MTTDSTGNHLKPKKSAAFCVWDFSVTGSTVLRHLSRFTYKSSVLAVLLLTGYDKNLLPFQ